MTALCILYSVNVCAHASVVSVCMCECMHVFYVDQSLGHYRALADAQAQAVCNAHTAVMQPLYMLQSL